MIVPLKRTIKPGMRGNDVLAVKRMLKYKGFGRGLQLKGDGRFKMGPIAVLQLKRFQKRYGVSQTGNYGPATHRKAVASRGFDAYGRWLMGSVEVRSPQDIQRAKIVSTALYGARQRHLIYYTQSFLRMMGVRQRIRPPAVPKWEDCSSFVTWCYWVAGARDPNGRGYDGFGYTGTLARNGWRVSSPRPGDLIFYGGGWPYGHVAVYIGGGKVVSHGSSSGPLVLYWRYRSVSAIRRYI